MKKYIVVILLFLFILSLFGCKTSENVENTITLEYATETYRSGFIPITAKALPSYDIVSENAVINNLKKEGDIYYCRFNIKGLDNVFYYIIFSSENGPFIKIVLTTFFVYDDLNNTHFDLNIGDDISAFLINYPEIQTIEESDNRFFEIVCQDGFFHCELNEENIIVLISHENSYMSTIDLILDSDYGGK